MKRPLIEVCVDSLESAVIASEAGADRIELNSAIAVGGLTPSTKLLSQVKGTTTKPIVCMVRNRIGNFSYSDQEFSQLLDDAKRLLDGGADGLAFGFVDIRGQIESSRIEQFVKLCGDRDAVFHRAIDCTSDIMRSFSQLMKLGVTRVLTSGGETTAEVGIDTIAQMCATSNGYIEVLPGSGINAGNVLSMMTKSGCDQIHGTFSKIESPTADFEPSINFNAVVGLKPNDRYVACAKSIQRVLSQFESVDG